MYFQCFNNGNALVLLQVAPILIMQACCISIVNTGYTTALHHTACVCLIKNPDVYTCMLITYYKTTITPIRMPLTAKLPCVETHRITLSDSIYYRYNLIFI